MEDSLEDFIRLVRNVNAPDNTKTAIDLRARELNAENEALRIVNYAIEVPVSPENFLQFLRFINPQYYDDIVVERYVTHLCGYPICGNKIKETTNKQYHISLKVNKVYDITERKYFCSNFCYKASGHIKDQIDTSPLHSRNVNIQPELKLLMAHEKVCPGEEILPNLKEQKGAESTFISVSSFTEASLDEAVELEKHVDRNDTDFDISKIVENSIFNNTPDEKLVNETAARRAEKESLKSELEDVIIKLKVDLKITDDNKEKIANNGKTNISKKKIVTPKTDALKSALDKVKKLQGKSKPMCLLVETKSNPELKSESIRKDITISTKLPPIKDVPTKLVITSFIAWTTPATFVEIHGKESLQTILMDKSISSRCLSDFLYESESQDTSAYKSLMHRLKKQELIDDNIDASILKRNAKSLRAVPEFNKLKEETRELKVKVRAFYDGKSFDQAPVMEESTSAVNEDNEVIPAVLPAVDTAGTHQATRRKIYMESVTSYIKEHIRLLRLSEDDVIPHVQKLVYTFQFQADNIVFKPDAWKAVALTLIMLLSMSNSNIKTKLAQTPEQSYISSYQCDIIATKLFDYYNNVSDYFK